MKELITELRNKVLYLRNTDELSVKGELILLHKLNALEKQFAISGVVVSDADIALAAVSENVDLIRRDGFIQGAKWCRQH
jgi:hypothetical protein